MPTTDVYSSWSNNYYYKPQEAEIFNLNNDLEIDFQDFKDRSYLMDDDVRDSINMQKGPESCIQNKHCCGTSVLLQSTCFSLMRKGLGLTMLSRGVVEVMRNSVNNLLYMFLYCINVWDFSGCLNIVTLRMLIPFQNLSRRTQDLQFVAILTFLMSILVLLV
ncbi:hypothetical protein NMG60_11011714 [Bertholletia excelsa]